MADKKEPKDEMVEVETLTDIGLEGREGYVAKGEIIQVSAIEAAKSPWAYSLTKKPSAKAIKQVESAVEAGKLEQKPEGESHLQVAPPPPMSEEEKAAAVAEAEAARQAEHEKEQKKGGKK